MPLAKHTIGAKIFGAFAAILFGAELANGGAPLLLLAGLAIGAASRHSIRAAAISLPF